MYMSHCGSNEQHMYSYVTLTAAEVTVELSCVVQRDCSMTLVNDCSKTSTASCNDRHRVLTSASFTHTHKFWFYFDSDSSMQKIIQQPKAQITSSNNITHCQSRSNGYFQGLPRLTGADWAIRIFGSLSRSASVLVDECESVHWQGSGSVTGSQ